MPGSPAAWGSASRRICCATASPPTLLESGVDTRVIRSPAGPAEARIDKLTARYIAVSPAAIGATASPPRPVAGNPLRPGHPRRARQTLMPRPALELADIFRQHGPAYRQSPRPCPLHQHRLMQAIEETPAAPRLIGRFGRMVWPLSIQSCPLPLLPQSPLPQVPRLGARPVASEAHRRVTSGRILSRSLHRAPGDRLRRFL